MTFQSPNVRGVVPVGASCSERFLRLSGETSQSATHLSLSGCLRKPSPCAREIPPAPMKATRTGSFTFDDIRMTLSMLETPGNNCKSICVQHPEWLFIPD